MSKRQNLINLIESLHDHEIELVHETLLAIAYHGETDIRFDSQLINTIDDKLHP